jgi:formylglycine-generating enzyme required for sulfatase activity
VSAKAAGTGTPQQATVTISPKDGGDIVLIRQIPQGMVLVAGPGGRDAFLIDRTEVSNSQWTSLGGRPLGSGAPGAAVAGISFDDARKWAERAGKRLPTVAQWTHAAFGAPHAKTPRYPWGDAEGRPEVHFVSGVDEAQSVESCPEGRSLASGCLNMAGNVWEWLDTGWLIGGGWRQTRFERLCQPPDDSGLQPWTADFLRDPLPPDYVYGGFTNKAEEAKYYNYRAKSNETLLQAGLRCVVPLGEPGR